MEQKEVAYIFDLDIRYLTDVLVISYSDGRILEKLGNWDSSRKYNSPEMGIDYDTIGLKNENSRLQRNE